MIRFIRNIPWKDILVIVLLGALCLGAVVGVTAAVTNKTKTVSSLKFERGAIDSSGAFIESDTSIYTADYIDCQGLHIEPDFDATGTYQVFYYDANKQFAGATDVMNTAENPVYDKGDTFAFAKYCKIVITPETPKDDDGYVVEDYKIKFYEPAGIAGKFTITVNKSQKNFEKVSVSVDESTLGKYFTDDQTVGSPLNLDASGENFAVSSNVDVKHASYFVLHSSVDAGMWRCCFLDSNDNVISTETIWIDTLGYVSVDVPKGACTLKIVLDPNETYTGFIIH